MISLEQIRNTYEQRKELYGPDIARMIEILTVYNGEWAVPLPEMNRNERTAVANLAQTGVDQTAMRVMSVMPVPHYLPLRTTSESSKKRARDRRDINLSWWELNHKRRKDRRRARELLAYACAPMVVRPGKIRGQRIPVWELRDPLTTYPANSLDPDDMLPPDCIFSYTRGRSWLKQHHPEAFGRLRMSKDTSKFTLLEYIDGEERVLLAMGDERDHDNEWGIPQGAPLVQLKREPNKTDMPWAVVPGRVTLGKKLGAYDGIIGMYQQQAELMALNLIGVKRAVMPETWLVGDGSGRRPKIITLPNARTGKVGEVQNGQIQTVNVNPSQITAQAMSQLEYAERHTAGIPPELGGSASTGVRTGQRGSQILSAVLDFPIQEAQELFEESGEIEDRIAIAVDKAYFPERKSVYFSRRGQIDYTPEITWETDEHYVRYPHAGMDARNLGIESLQKVGAKMLDRESAMEQDPQIDDPELVKDRLFAQDIYDAFVASIQAQAANPEAPLSPGFLSKLGRAVVAGKDPFDAYADLQEEEQKKQAGEIPQDPTELMPGAQGAMQPPAEQQTIPPPPGSLEHLDQLVGRIQGPRQAAARGAA